MPESNLNPDSHDKLTKAFLVGIQLPEATREEAEELLEELRELVNTLGLEIVGSDIGRIRKRNPAYGLGPGTAKELAEAAAQAEADVIIIDDPMTPAQQRNWEKLADMSVIDRQEVILDIFASRAHTREATLQVALAKAQYALPRLKRRWTHLSRQRGAAGGLGGRAEGEQQLELDSRVIRNKIAKLHEQLAEVRKQRDTQRQQRLRKPVPVATIVGYTNAGKSSLLNALTQAGVFAEDKLFATLDPTVRRFRLPGGQDILLADTVGFIRKLPHQLVEAFKATLEETRLADYIIEVLDASAPNLAAHHATTRQVLQDIGCELNHTVTVLNKIDQVTPEQIATMLYKFPDALLVSAKTGAGLDDLASELEARTTELLDTAMALVPHDRYDLIAKIHNFCSIIEETYLGEGVFLVFKQVDKIREAVAPFLLDARPAEASGGFK